MIFVFDENYPKEFVRGLAILEQANKRSKISPEIVFAPEMEGLDYGVDDDVLIPAFSKQQAIIVTHDKDFARVKHLKPLLIQHEVGFVIFRIPKGGYQYWDIVKAFINKWEELKEKILESKPPFAFEVNKSGQLNPLNF